MSDNLKRANVTAARHHGNPRPRVDSLGYTLRGGSPSTIQVKVSGQPDNRWRRVYVLQFSNAASHFIMLNGERHYISLTGIEVE